MVTAEILTTRRQPTAVKAELKRWNNCCRNIRAYHLENAWPCYDDHGNNSTFLMC